MELRNGSLLKLFPYTYKGNTTWYAPTDSLPKTMDREHQQFVRSIFFLLSDYALTSDYAQMDAVVGKMLKYQQKNGEHRCLPTDVSQPSVYTTASPSPQYSSCCVWRWA